MIMVIPVLHHIIVRVTKGNARWIRSPRFSTKYYNDSYIWHTIHSRDEADCVYKCWWLRWLVDGCYEYYDVDDAGENDSNDIYWDVDDDDEAIHADYDNEAGNGDIDELWEIDYVDDDDDGDDHDGAVDDDKTMTKNFRRQRWKIISTNHVLLSSP